MFSHYRCVSVFCKCGHQAHHACPMTSWTYLAGPLYENANQFLWFLPNHLKSYTLLPLFRQWTCKLETLFDSVVSLALPLGMEKSMKVFPTLIWHSFKPWEKTYEMIRPQWLLIWVIGCRTIPHQECGLRLRWASADWRMKSWMKLN